MYHKVEALNDMNTILGESVEVIGWNPVSNTGGQQQSDILSVRSNSGWGVNGSWQAFHPSTERPEEVCHSDHQPSVHPQHWTFHYCCLSTMHYTSLYNNPDKSPPLWEKTKNKQKNVYISALSLLGQHFRACVLFSFHLSGSDILPLSLTLFPHPLYYMK